MFRLNTLSSILTERLAGPSTLRVFPGLCERASQRAEGLRFRSSEPGRVQDGDDAAYSVRSVYLGRRVTKLGYPFWDVRT